MSKDIRSFFSVLSKSKSKEEIIEKTKSKKRVFNVDSDEEDDALVTKPLLKKSKDEKHKKEASSSVKKKEPEKKPAKPADLGGFFGESPIHQKPQTLIKPSEKKEEIRNEPALNGKKRKKKSKGQPVSLEDPFDDDFDASLSLLDEEQIIESVESSTKNKTPEKVKKDLPTNNRDKLKSSPPKDPKKVTPEKINLPEILERGSSSKKRSNTPKTKEKELTPADNDPKRKASAEAYQRYLNRGGPRNPGSKVVPEGTPTCLQGLSFVITGVLESLERDDAADLIQNCGGRVTSSVSKKTSYVILGDEPGQSKLKKAEQFKIPQLSEDGLLDLIRSRSSSKKESTVAPKSEEVVNSAYFSKEKDKSVSPAMKRLKLDDTEKKGKEKKIVVATTDSIAQKISPKKEILVPSKKVAPSIASSQTSGLGSSMTFTDSYEHSATEDSYTPTIQLGDSLWVDKYKPKSTKTIIGQNGDKSNVKKLIKWLNDWPKHHSKSDKKRPARPAPWAQGDDGSYYKAALLSGPPGVGKTTSVHLVCQELGFDVVEFNASDTRSKRLLTEHVSELLASRSIKNFYSAGETKSKNKVLVMDEVDGMAGNEDRGGVQELIQLIKNTRVPIICMCNDRSHPKMRSLVNYCFDLRFNRPRLEQIKGAMLSICCREGIKVPGDALNDIILSANQDIRQVLHNLSLWVVKDKGLTSEQAKIDASKAKKSLKMGPWDVARQVFAASSHERSTLREKEELFFQDYSLGPLFVQETYIQVKPHKASGDKKKTLDCLSKAADSLAWGDVVERAIRSSNAWSLLPVQAIFSSVLPGHYMSGHVMGQITFPSWLGKNSKRGKMDRLLQELHVHTRLRTSGSKKAVNLDYSHMLRDAILKPLSSDGADGIPASLEVMHHYQLLREDLDSLVELCQWPSCRDPFAAVDSKVKAAFTRAYNKESLATPYATFSVKKTKGSDGDGLEALDDAEDVGDEEEVDDISTDAMIKKGKPKKAATKKEEASTSGKKGQGSKKESSSRKNTKK